MFRPVRHFEVSRQRVRVAAELDLPEGLPDCDLAPREGGRLDRAARALLWAGAELMQTSGGRAAGEVPVVLGTTCGGMELGERYYKTATVLPLRRRSQPTRSLYYQAQLQAGTFARAFGICGPVTVISNACASGANAVGHAWELVRSGRADRVVCGGYDTLCQLVFSGFDSLQALSPTQCRPFDSRRDGLALGEGVALFLLEPWEAARERGARVVGEILGYGAATDGHHLTQPHPEGHAAFASMTLACERAGLSAGDIQYVNAHGTGTPANDVAEAHAIGRWAGDRAPALMVSSTKSSVGHLLGAAGALETAIGLMALEGQWIPPTLTCESVDPVCGFQVVTRPTSAVLRHVLTNSFGFGGANASLVLGRGA